MPSYCETAGHTWTRNDGLLCVMCGAIRSATDEQEGNTDELLEHFAKKREAALAKPEGILREIAVKSAADSEWHTLWSILQVPAMRTLYDGDRVAERLDELRRALTKDKQSG